MRRLSLIAAAAAAAALTGCVSYPVYQPVPVARLTPEQSAALASRPLTQSERDSYAAANAQVQRDDQAQQQVAVPYTYAYPAAPYYAPYYGYGYAGYPSAYYGGFYPWYPSLSLSFGYRGGFGGGYRGGYRGGYGGGRHR